MGILMLIFSLCRILLFGFNAEQFNDVKILDFVAGMWFDLITTCLLFYPLIVIELFPNKNRKSNLYVWLSRIFTVLPFFLGTLINLIDIEYFHHTASRSTYGLITMLGYGNDLMQQLPSFFTDYWYILLLLVVFLLAAFIWIKKLNQKEDDSRQHSLKKQTVIYLLSIGLFIFVGRGGFVSKPIRITEAAKYTSPSNIQLILNSAFTMINSWGSSGLEEKKYLTTAELDSTYSPIRQYNNEGRLEGQNIVILIVESFSPEYIGKMNESGISSTPFFDGLIDSSLLFTNCFANGKKSLDAVPSIVASIPKLMPDEYLLSSYMANKIHALPEILSSQKYSTSFFHGATNGSMNFDSFCELAGYQNYFGRNEYANEEDYDGTWGIFDEPFMLWSVDQFSKLKKPFFSTLFTISSHPPYAIPDKYKSIFNSGPTKMHNAIEYTDFALSKFFEKASKESWYDNTLFIITADHTPASKNQIYAKDIGQMRIPLLFFHPTDSFFRGTNEKIVGQIDIMPTILDLIGYKQEFLSFGSSIFTNEQAYTACNIRGKFMLFGSFENEDYLLTYQNDTPLELYNLKDVEQAHNLLNSEVGIVASLQRQLEAIIQVHNHRMISNQLTVKSE